MLFLHSKSNKSKRLSYFEPLINNLDKITNSFNHHIGCYTADNILLGDFGYLKKTLSKIDYPKWSKRNSYNMINIVKYLKLSNDFFLFPEGNCYILKSPVIQKIFTDTKLYNILNTENSLDVNWVRKYYQLNTYDIKKIYEIFQKKNLLPNNFLAPKEKNMPDAMIEHTFERLIFNIVYNLNMDFKIFNKDGEIKNNIIKYFKYNSKYKFQKTKKNIITIIACHTNSNLKKISLINNIKYFLEISDKIIIINSDEYKNETEEIFNNYNDNDYYSNKIELHYVPNDKFYCYSKWINYLDSIDFMKEEKKYTDFILTNDSFVVIKNLSNFKNIFHEDIELSSFMISNEGKKHSQDYLRRYSFEGLSKIKKYYKDCIKNNYDIKCFKKVIDIFEMNSYAIFKEDKKNYLFQEEKKDVNVNFDDYYLEKYIKHNNYNIIKIKKLQFTVYDSNELPFDFDPFVYKNINPDLKNNKNYNDKKSLIKHFLLSGKVEGRLYKKNQKIKIPTYLKDILEDCNLKDILGDLAEKEEEINLNKKIIIATMVKNEEDIIDCWIKYYGKIFGYENLFIIDNISNDNTYNICKSYLNKGINLSQEEDYRKKGELMTQIMYNNKCDIFIQVDIDEFLIYYDHQEKKVDPHAIISYLEQISTDNCKFVKCRELKPVKTQEINGLEKFTRVRPGGLNLGNKTFVIKKNVKKKNII